jgi:putative lipoic acid-binding regulatory protein
MTAQPRWENLMELLRKETFPLAYTLKLIGRNDSAFQEGCLKLMQQHPMLQQTGSRGTSNAQSISITFQFTAQSAEEIIVIYQNASSIPGLLVLL